MNAARPFHRVAFRSFLRVGKALFVFIDEIIRELIALRIGTCKCSGLRGRDEARQESALRRIQHLHTRRTCREGSTRIGDVDLIAVGHAVINSRARFHPDHSASESHLVRAGVERHYRSRFQSDRVRSNDDITVYFCTSDPVAAFCNGPCAAPAWSAHLRLRRSNDQRATTRQKQRNGELMDSDFRKQSVFHRSSILCV